MPSRPRINEAANVFAYRIEAPVATPHGNRADPANEDWLEENETLQTQAQNNSLAQFRASPDVD